MSILHTVNKSPFERNTLASCVRHALDGSAVLLIEDGVYAALADAKVDVLQAAIGRLQLYVLAADLHARGIKPERLIDEVAIVDYDGFVALAVEHDSVQTWV